MSVYQDNIFGNKNRRSIDHGLVISIDVLSRIPFLIYITAITDISTLTFLGKIDTSTASLAGGFLSKYFA